MTDFIPSRGRLWAPRRQPWSSLALRGFVSWPCRTQSHRSWSSPWTPEDQKKHWWIKDINNQLSRKKNNTRSLFSFLRMHDIKEVSLENFILSLCSTQKISTCWFVWYKIILKHQNRLKIYLIKLFYFIKADHRSQALPPIYFYRIIHFIHPHTLQ